MVPRGELFIFGVLNRAVRFISSWTPFAISDRCGLQFGVPLKSYVKTLRGTPFPCAQKWHLRRQRQIRAFG